MLAISLVFESTTKKVFGLLGSLANLFNLISLLISILFISSEIISLLIYFSVNAP